MRVHAVLRERSCSSAHPRISDLAEALVSVFVSIEMTGQGVQFEHKFKYRQPMYVALEYIWKIDLHRDSIKVRLTSTGTPVPRYRVLPVMYSLAQYTVLPVMYSMFCQCPAGAGLVQGAPYNVLQVLAPYSVLPTIYSLAQYSVLPVMYSLAQYRGAPYNVLNALQMLAQYTVLPVMYLLAQYTVLLVMFSMPFRYWPSTQCSL